MSKMETQGPLPDSVRSVGTSTSVRSTNSESSSQRISSLQSNLMRTLSHRDPMEIYEVIEILGEGSMGSVSRVRKRSDAVGGSARAAFVQKHSASSQCCFGMCTWLKLPGQKDAFIDSSRTAITVSNDSSTLSKELTSSQGSTTSGQQFYRKQSSLVKYSEKKKENFYALKSIHLDRCSTKEYVDELKNEVAILKSLDHPNIVRAIETYDYNNRLYLVLSLCSGGDLYTREPYTESAAQAIVKSLFSAVAYLHSRGIVHRDVSGEE